MLTRNSSQEISIKFNADNSIVNNADLTGNNTNMVFTESFPANGSLKRKHDKEEKVSSILKFLTFCCEILLT